MLLFLQPSSMLTLKPSTFGIRKVLQKIPDSQTHIYAQKVKHGCICPLSMAGGSNQLRDHRLLQISLTPVNLEVNLKENGNRMANTGKSLYLDMYRFEWERGDFA